MALVVDIARNGDLYVAVGKDDHKQLVKVSRAVLQNASLVFDAMLGPLFKEGQSAHDRPTDPLDLPEDDPIATANLFKILHWRSEDVVKSQSDGVQRILIAADKYKWSERIADWFRCRATLLKPRVDLMVMFACIGDRVNFGPHSEQIVRLDKSTAESLCHEGLAQLLPEDFLSQLSTYRSTAQRKYRSAAQKPIISMFTAAVNNKLCVGLEKRLARYMEILIDENLISGEDSNDTELRDALIVLEVKVAKLDSENRCMNLRHQSCACSWNTLNAVRVAFADVKGGTSASCRLCIDCFRAGKCSFEQACAAAGNKCRVTD